MRHATFDGSDPEAGQAALLALLTGDDSPRDARGRFAPRQADADPVATDFDSGARMTTPAPSDPNETLNKALLELIQSKRARTTTSREGWL